MTAIPDTDLPASRLAARMALVILAEGMVVSLLFFAGAGTFDCEWGWSLLAVGAASLIPALFGLAVHSPGLLASRTRLAPEGQPLADRVFVPLHSALILAWAWASGRDVSFVHWLPVPDALKAAALLAIPAVTWAGYRTMRDNPFLAPCVCLQEERAHRVIDSGAYGVVRHPFYAVALAYQGCASLVLGSGFGLLMTGLVGLALAARIGIEERFLERELPGYAAYRRRTPWRLLPGLW